MRTVPLRILTALAIAIFPVVLAACGEDGDDSFEAARTEFAPETAPPDDAEDGGTLEVIAADDVDYIDPGAQYYQFSYMIAQASQRTLVAWPPEETKEPQPDLAAEQPEISEDGQTITFTIRDGVMFSPPVDREVTAADVEYAIERSIMPGVANFYVPGYLAEVEGFDEAVDAAEEDETVAPDIQGITATDDKTLEIQLTKPTAAVVIQSLSLPVSAPVPEEYAKEFDAENPSEYGFNQVATGPYMIENDENGEAIGYEPGKSIHLVRNPNWDPETDFRPAYVDEIQVTEGFTDVNSATRKILSGESQVNGDILPEPEGLKLAAQDYPDQLQMVPGTGNRYITLNVTVPPLDDLNVRKAILAAADRDALRLERGGEIVGPVATHFLQPTMPGFEEAGGLEGDPDLDYIQDPSGDPELAAEYFRAAGYESGKYEGDDEILIVSENAGVDKRVGEAVNDLFEELGFNVTFREVSADAMLTKFCPRPAADVAVCPTGWLKDFNDPESMLKPIFDGDQIKPVNNNNWSELDVPEINEAMDEAALVTDPDERAQAWGEIDTMLMEQVPAIPYVWDDQANVYSANVNAVMNLANGQTDLSFTSLEAGGS